MAVRRGDDEHVTGGLGPGCLPREAVVDQVMVVAEDHCRRDQQRQRGGWQVVLVVGEHPRSRGSRWSRMARSTTRMWGRSRGVLVWGDRIRVEALLAGLGGEVLIDLPEHVAGATSGTRPR
jgi:hypothetical protein